MNLNDQYEELTLYLVKAENDIARAFQTELPRRNTSDIRPNSSQQGIPGIDRYLNLGAYPKTDHNVQKVHFADTKASAPPEIPVRNERNSPSHYENGYRSPRSGNYLKSCLKNPHDIKMDVDYLNPRREHVNPYNLNIGPPLSNPIDMQRLNAARNYSYLLDDYYLRYPPSPLTLWPSAQTTAPIPPRQYLNPNYYYRFPNLHTAPLNNFYEQQLLKQLPINLEQNYQIQELQRKRQLYEMLQNQQLYEEQQNQQLYEEQMNRELYEMQQNQQLQEEQENMHLHEMQQNQQYNNVQQNQQQYEVQYQHGVQHQQQNEESQVVNGSPDSDKELFAFIESIKADMEEMKNKSVKDDEIERNRHLTQELDQILNMFKKNKEKETDILSDVASNSSYLSVQTTSTQTPTPITNLSKGSEYSSSPCLKSVSDSDLADDDQSISSSESTYHTPPDWVAEPTPQAVLRGKSSSAPVLKNQQPKVNKQARSQSDRHLDEIEAIEACKWLKATGFPQYAQMFEDMLFPIDLATVAKDHPRLDPDALASLFRRLQILNKCAHLHQQRITHNTDESEDEHYALSKNWTFQADIRRWSRACTTEPSENDTPKATIKTSESDEVFEGQSEPPRERVRRTGSVKFHRRREGVIISESGAKLLDSLSEQLSGLSIASGLNASDSELTPKFYNRLWRKPSERGTDSNSSDNKIAFQESSVKDADSNIFYCKFSSQQLGQLDRIAMLKITAYVEKHCPTHRTGWNWEVPKNLIRKMKNPAYKDKVVFGVPIQLTLQRTGHPLPRNIENALEWLQQNAIDQVGLFRKSGVKSRIQTLRNAVESSTGMISFEDQQPYDVADMVKQYFRELPEALLTNKLSETFKLIFQFVPVELRLEAVLSGIFLMPDEHKEVLQTLISFLISIARHSNQNQMNESNLATCFAPSLFHYSQLSKPNLGCPHPKDLAENKAAHDCLRFFLENHEKLFTIPKTLLNQCNPVEMREWKVLTLSELGNDMGGWREYLKECEQQHLKEVKDKSRGWTVLSNSHNPKVEMYHKKIDDGLSVRVWKAIADVDAPPSEVMLRILRERHIWDLELMSAKIVVQLDKNVEIFQYGRKRMSLLPIEEYCVVRQWKSDFPKGACLIVETSVEHEEILHIPESIRGIVHASRYYIEPCGSGRSRIFHMCRTDTMGRKPEYYYKNYGHVIANFMSNIQNSFYQQAGGPESKV